MRPPTQRRPTLVAATAPPPHWAAENTAKAVPETPAAPQAGPDDDLPPPHLDTTPKRAELADKPQRPLSPLGIRVSSAVGFEPLLLTYSADCPSDWLRTAKFAWLLDGRSIGEGVNGQRTLAQPGDYSLDLVAVTKDGVEHRASRRIRVLKSVETSAVPGSAMSP